MSAFVLSPQMRTIAHSISEIWYIIIFSVITWDINYSLIKKGWDTSSFLSLLFFALLIALLIKQIFRRTGWISLLFGFIFSFVSLYMIGALLSEYSEFPTGTESNAIWMLIVGGTLFGISLILGIRMCQQGAYRLYMS